MKVSKWSCINIISLLSKAIGLFSHNVYYVKLSLCGINFIIKAEILVYQVRKNGIHYRLY